MPLRKLAVFFAALTAAVFAGCAGSTPSVPKALPMPQAVSPASIAAPPMAKTAILPRSAMQSPRSTAADIVGLNWTQLPGSATQVTGGGDGSIWVLSTLPAGPDKYIWHYSNGTWTNVGGLANHIAAAPNGTLYVTNSGGGTYAYSNGSWTALGGGASDVTAAADGSTYVLSNGGAGPDQPIWHNLNGTWTQLAGAGTQIAASWDTGSYNVSGKTLGATGLYILNSVGGIYYENSGSTFAMLPGPASAIAPTTNGGAFVLGFPTNAAGNSLYYFDLSNPTGWIAEPGAGVSIASDGKYLYVVGASGAIYEAPLIASTPSASSTSLTFASPSAAAQPVTVSEAGYTGTLAESDKCNPVAGRIATVSPASASGPSALFTVTPNAGGTCAVTITNSMGKSVQINVTVTPVPPSASASYLTFSSSSGGAQSLTITESGYTGTFTESDNCNPVAGRIATVSPASASGPSAIFGVAPSGNGNCVITITDSRSNSLQIGVTVGSSTIIVQ